MRSLRAHLKRLLSGKPPRPAYDYLVVEKMEARVLFSADLNPLGTDFTAHYQQAINHESQVSLENGMLDAQPSEQQRQRTRELIVVDESVDGAEDLVNQIRDSAEPEREFMVILLSAESDGIEQISAHVDAAGTFDAWHVISHGDSAAIQLGNTTLDQTSAQSRSGELARWADGLTHDADLLFYGCNLAASADGLQLIQTLADLTGADVAASDDLTGASDLGGDWELEVSTGVIDTALALSASIQADFDGVLATITVSTFSDTVDGDTSSISNLLGSQGADGSISLREAITASNNTAGSDTISFSIAGSGVHTINVTSALPTITDTVILDATTDDSFAANSNRPAIIVDGNNLAADGLALASTADGSTIRGLVIRDFAGNGIQIDAGSDNNTIAGNYIGALNASGSYVGGEENANEGITVLGANNTIGGSTALDRNVISGNTNSAVVVIGAGATGNAVTGNYLGTTASGLVAVGNSKWGVDVFVAGSGNVIGGNTSSLRNVIGGNSLGGIALNDTSGTTIQGNYIGVGADGTTALANTFYGGILHIGGPSTGNTIGGTGVGEGNLIANNTGRGIDVAGGSVAILGNSIFNNSSQGIDLGDNNTVQANDAGDADTGANNLQNFPVLTSANGTGGDTVIIGSLNSAAATNYRIEFFSSPTGDGSGHGEGQTYLGFTTVTTDGSGDVSFNTNLTGVSVTPGHVVSATATVDLGGGNYGDTSEFATNVTATGNTAPTLDNTRSPVITAINEDAGPPVGGVGTLVSSLVDFAIPSGQVDNVTDPDAGAVLGIAVTAADTTNGSWHYSLDGGTNWNALGAVSETSARLLAADANTRLAFEPNADYNGTLPAAITFRAWDQFSGSNGALADTSDNGVGTAFSTDTDTASLVVNAVNDAPVNTVPASATVTEEVATAIAGISIADVDAAAANNLTTRLQVSNGVLNVTPSGSATISAGSNGSGDLTIQGSVADINTTLGSLTYTGNTNVFGVNA
ncbi:MAG: DUF4347 domain-containing protein, partial [Burkholderiaceae bacterium]